MNREMRNTISCVPRPHTHSEVSAMMTLRPRLAHSGRSFARCGGRARDPRAEDKIFPLCNEISTAPDDETAFTFLPLALSPRTLAKVARLIYQTQVPSRRTWPVSRPHFPSFPFTRCRRNVWPPFPPDDGRNFRYRSLQEGERKEMLNGWPSVQKQLALQQKYIFVHECRRWKLGQGTLAKVLSLSSRLL